MGFSTLTWNYDSAAGDGFRIYRSDTPMDPEALPTPLDEVAITEREYVDTTVVADSTYYYRVSVYAGTTENVSAELEHVAEDSGDDYWSFVKALLHFDDIDGSTTFTDVIGNTFAVRSGSPEVSTDQSKFGGSSLYLNGAASLRCSSGDGITNIGTRAMVWTGWVRLNAMNRSIVMNIGNADSNSTGRTCQLHIEPNGSIGFYGGAVRGSAGVGSQSTPAGVILVDTWHYVEASVTAGNPATWRIFVDGVKQFEDTFSRGSFNASGITIGRGYYTAVYYVNGYLDEWRLTVGSIRNTADYTPPTAPEPDFGI